jgi:4-diphosphocytidyl-2-C-methyl-D-erythritol kinase
MIIFPNAKINIGLRILRKRGDGYHDIESVFYPVGLTDMLEILPSHTNLNDKRAKISVSGIAAPATSENLCLKATRLLRDRLGTPEVDIYLHKNIPMESGLGGGSSDAVFTLLALNEMFSYGLKEEVLHQYASEIGSDCPFFIYNRPCLVGGKGDIMEPFDLSLKGYYLLIVFPEASVPTPEAYKMISPSEDGLPLREILQLKPEQWKELVVNRFEEVVFARYPEIGQIKELLYRSGAVYASMSGSGSAVYGIFSESPPLSGELKNYNIHTEALK